MNRRTFIQSSAIAMASGMTARGANDRINVAVVGVRGRGRDHILPVTPSFLKRASLPYADIDQAQIERAVQLNDKPTRLEAAEDLPGHSQAARRQRRRRRLHRDVQPLACSCHGLGLPGGQRCVRRKAREP